MKFSIATSILILIVGGAMGWMQQQKLAGLKEDERKLAKDATELGIVVETDSLDGRGTKRPRDPAGGSKGRSVASELAAFAKEREERKKHGTDSEDDFEKRGTELILRLIELDPGQLKVVIGELRNDASLSEESRRNMIGFSILMLGEDHPAAALALFKETSDLLGGKDLGKQLVSFAMTRWAKQDPAAALEWFRKNAATNPDIADEDAKRSLVGGAAESDPKTALKLLEDLKIEDKSAAIVAVVEAGTTPEKRTEVLTALREYLQTVGDGTEREDLLHEALEEMGRNLDNETFESATSWVSKADLSPDERVQFAGGLSYFNTKKETGAWIDWMSKNLPEDAVQENADNLIGQWVQQDYLAAGQWLSAAQEGPAKNASVATYATTVAEYEPQVAVQWALTLPEGQQRQGTLQSIYENWPKSDAAAGAAFATKYGLDTQPSEDDDP